MDERYTYEHYRCTQEHCLHRGPALLINECHEPHGEVTYDTVCADCGGSDIEEIDGLTSALAGIGGTWVTNSIF